jgi:hypothetical protein
MDMRLLVFMLILAAAPLSCKKSGNCPEVVTVVKYSVACGSWGIVKGSTTYPVDTIPAHFQKEGMQVCISYEVYEDRRTCACCGGTWVRIDAISEIDH